MGEPLTNVERQPAWWRPPDGWLIGDRVEVGSVWAIPRRPRGPGRPWSAGVRATGHIEGFTKRGAVIVAFDCGPVNGVDWCSASSSELTRIEETR